MSHSLAKPAARADETPAVDDRRHWTRAPGLVDFVVLWPGEPCATQAPVIDESLAGLAVTVEDVARLQTDQQLRIEYAGQPLWVQVRHIAPDGSGSYKIGLQWPSATLAPEELERLVEGLM